MVWFFFYYTSELDGHATIFLCLRSTKAFFSIYTGSLFCNTSPCCHSQACLTLVNINPNMLFEICESGSGEICASDKFPDRVNAFIFLHSDFKVLSDLESVHGRGMREVVRVQSWKAK